MCLYEPPLFLGTPDVSAAMICAFPLAVSAVGWRELVSSTIGFLLALALLGGVVGSFLVADAWALPASSVERPPVIEDIIIADCFIPPFGEGLTGYTMLAVLVIFEVLVAVGIADMLKRLFAR